MKFIILGSGESGSGAIIDYLISRPDVHRPLKKEFRLVQDPGGLVDLHSSIIFGFHVNRASYAIKRFKDFCERCGRKSKNNYRNFPNYQYGLNYSAFIHNYFEKVNKFLNRITLLSYDGMPSCERINLNQFDTIKYERLSRKAKVNQKKIMFGEMYLPVDETLFLQETELFLNELFTIENESDNFYKVVDQGGSFWAPYSTTKYYGEKRKVIVVSRDPRDIFTEFQIYGQAYPGSDVRIFCKWYKHVMININKSEWEKDNVLHVRFEDFIQNYQDEVKRVNKHLGISDSEVAVFEPEKSLKNIGKFKSKLAVKDVAVLEQELSNFLHY